MIRTQGGSAGVVRRGRRLTIPAQLSSIQLGIDALKREARNRTRRASGRALVAGRRAGFAALLALLALTAATACGGDGDGAPSERLVNPGFEDGKTGWTALAGSDGWEPDFAISEDVARSGERSALLEMGVPPERGDVRIFGVTQEVAPGEMPEQLGGWYRVEGWQRATAKQYLQVVVIVFNAENRPLPQATNHQIRYILAGITEPPFNINNAKYVFAGPAEPAQGEWVPFTFPVAEDFARLWGEAPVNFEKVRLLFEVRYDGRVEPEEPSADVYYDDLHFGAADGGGP